MSAVDRDALREAVADALPFTTDMLFHGPQDWPTREMRLRTADALLAGPLAPLLDAADAVTRVEALAKEWDTQAAVERQEADYSAAGAFEDCAEDLRAALRGDR